MNKLLDWQSCSSCLLWRSLQIFSLTRACQKLPHSKVTDFCETAKVRPSCFAYRLSYTRHYIYCLDILMLILLLRSNELRYVSYDVSSIWMKFKRFELFFYVLFHFKGFEYTYTIYPSYSTYHFYKNCTNDLCRIRCICIIRYTLCGQVYPRAAFCRSRRKVRPVPTLELHHECKSLGSRAALWY